MGPHSGQRHPCGHCCQLCGSGTVLRIHWSRPAARGHVCRCQGHSRLDVHPASQPPPQLLWHDGLQLSASWCSTVVKRFCRGAADMGAYPTTVPPPPPPPPPHTHYYSVMITSFASWFWTVNRFWRDVANRHGCPPYNSSQVARCNRQCATLLQESSGKV